MDTSAGPDAAGIHHPGCPLAQQGDQTAIGSRLPGLGERFSLLLLWMI